MKEILFISDLHLAWEKPGITRRFIKFMETRALSASALYILGDLFDAWVGDDDFTLLSKTVRDQIKALTAAGIPVYLQHGNRDFLIARSFCDDTGATLLEDYHVIGLFGERTLLMHGDLLCTDDHAYQAFRNKSRSPEWQQNVLKKPLLVRLLAARWYRLRSFFHKRQKTLEIMDINQDTVVETMSQFGCKRLIHGHTHRPAVHDFEIAGQPVQRIVLADWTETKGEVLVWNKKGCYREAF